MTIASPFRLFALIALLGFGLQVVAQKRALGVPEQYQRPIDYFAGLADYEKFLRSTQNKSRDEAWLVFSDRENNTVYDKPDFNSAQIGSLKFREYFYVTDEKDDWIEIVSAEVNELRIVNLKARKGWVPKKNMVLWNKGLLDRNTRIHKKVFLLNRADAIQHVLEQPDKALVKVYGSPNGKHEQPQRKIFDFYFVLKREGQFVLLSQDAEIAPIYNDKIIGWVDSRRLTVWDTRVCLEPNFTEPAFNERKAEKRYQVKAFKDFTDAEDYAKSGQAANVFWQDDPVTVPAARLARANPRRYNGYVVRFPMLNMVTKDTIDIYETGVIGSIKVRKDGAGTSFSSEIAEIKYARIKAYIDQLNHKVKNVNIFFVVEASDSMYAFKQPLLDAIGQVNSELTQGVSVKYGALLYRDALEDKTGGGNGVVQSKSLTSDLQSVIDFINKAEFRSNVDRDRYTAMWYGVQQGIQAANFREDELNIMVLVGCYGDYRADPDRKALAVKSKDKTLVEKNTILQNLNARNVHLYGIQVRNEGNRPSDAFLNHSQSFILGTAQEAYNTFYGNKTDVEVQDLLKHLNQENNLQLLTPTMGADYTQNRIPLVGGRTPGLLTLPAKGRYLNASQLAAVMKENIGGSLEFEKALLALMSNVYLVGNELTEEDLKVSAGRLAPAVADVLTQIMKDDQISTKEMKDGMEDKYKLYATAYIPRNLAGARNQSISYVLFMPETDLLDYKRTIERGIARSTTGDKKREQLFEMYKDLVAQFAGDEYLKKSKTEDLTREDVLRVMQGVQDEGLKLDVDLNVRIGDILDEKKVPNSQLDALLLRFREVAENLDRILRQGSDYEFCYPGDEYNRYYWIPVKDAF